MHHHTLMLSLIYRFNEIIIKRAKMILLVSSLLFIFSCSNKTKVDLVIDDVINLELPTGFYPNRIKILDIDKDTNIIIFNWRTGDLYFFENQKVRQKKYNNFNAIFVESLDSIYLIDKYKGLIQLTNNKFDSINKWKIPRFINSIPYYMNTNLKSNFIEFDDKLYLTVYPNIHRDSFYTKHNEIIFSLSEGKIKKLYKKFPLNYSKTNYWGAVGDFVIKVINNQNEIFFMYPMNNNVFKLNQNNIEEIEMPQSKYLVEFPPEPIPYPTPNNSKFNSEYSIRTPSYVNFIYDSYRNIYYKIVNHRQPVNNGKLKNSYNSKPWSIMIFNKEFEFLDEKFMESGLYLNNYFFVMRDGLYILLQDENNYDGNISLQKFKVNYEE